MTQLAVPPIPDRSAITPPLAANKYGIAMRIICVAKEIGFMLLPVSVRISMRVELQERTSRQQ